MCIRDSPPPELNGHCLFIFIFLTFPSVCLSSHSDSQDVVDVSDGCGAKFECVIVSPAFDGKPILERHRMVNEILSEEMKSIHAFSMRTLTPEQWNKIQTKG